MLLLSCWSIIVFICLHFANTQVTIWSVTVCLTNYYRKSLQIILNERYKNVNWENQRKCFYTNFELNSGVKPSFIEINMNYYYGAYVENPYLPEMYGSSCSPKCFGKVNLKKWVHWNIAVLFSEINYFPYQSFKVTPDRKRYLKFREDSRTSNASFFLPMEMNTKSKIVLETKGQFWLEKIVILKNMKTSKIYSCLYLDHIYQTLYHECSLTNDSVWKIELTSRQKLVEDKKKIWIFVGITGSETNFSRQLQFKKLAYLPTFSAFINFGNISIGETEISFVNKGKYFDIFKIAMTRMRAGEEYGCVNIKTNSPEYSCKLLNSKNWLLKIISPEEHERNFTVEIIQDKLSSFSRDLSWNHLTIYGARYIRYFNLKTYEEGEITSLKLHFVGKSLKINEVNLINNFTEYKFKTNEGNKTQDNLVTEFIRTIKEKQEKREKIHSNESNLIMKIVVGLFGVIILFLIIIIIILIARNKMSSNKKVSKDNISTLQVAGEFNNHLSTRDTNSVAISEPRLEFCSLQQDSLDIYENLDAKSNAASFEVVDCDLYAMPEPRRPAQPAQPVDNFDNLDNPDIEQLYTQPIKYICR
ncbi:uncharacterized protein LOC106873224 isoform X2 [Octopus bimaculoides]|uniref:uncharacterized protein LOC106873224 isoform X2 n=1 Tax=Octopus bimaculoides TaxID=37653 RepID=UPI0022E63C92|nr:uncharacterized protein LOC106873224 isoform X2 [Octopus bimaculoides]XP_052828176.1 uncharacterized protein LOC106873224 isoform X2 [Octopus bimaculoides]